MINSLVDELNWAAGGSSRPWWAKVFIASPSNYRARVPSRNIVSTREWRLFLDSVFGQSVLPREQLIKLRKVNYVTRYVEVKSS